MKLFKKWWFWVVAVLVVIIVVASQGGKTDQVSGDDATVTTTKAVTTTAAKDKVINAVGESLETKNFKVTVHELNKLESSNQFIQPAEGKEFWEIVIEIENKSDKDYTVSSMLMFSSYVDDYSVDESFSAHTLTDNSSMDGGLAKGKKLKGSLAYELPKDWKELEIHMDLTLLTLSTDGEIKILLKNE